MTTLSDTQAGARRGRLHSVLADKAARADRHRGAIRAFAAVHEITIGELARRAGYKNANAFYNFLNGRSSGLSTATLLRICDSFPGTMIDHLLGRGCQARVRTRTVRPSSARLPWWTRNPHPPASQREAA